MRHSCGWCGTVPMFLPRWEPDHVPRMNFLDRATPALDPATAAVTIRVWPSGWVCQAVRAPGSKVTLEPLARAGSGAWNRGSIRTAPVKYSADALPEGCEPLLLMSMCSIPPLSFFLLSVWRLSCSLTVGSSLEEKSSLPTKAARHVLCLVVIIDAPSNRVVE
jgi:hypothetical protein